MRLTSTALALLVLAFTACSKTPEEATLPSVASMPSAADTASSAAMPMAAVDDVDVTTKVQTALLQDPALKAFDIKVVTLKGDVRLTGMVDTQAQIDEALRLTRAAEGVHSIHDELSLKK
jgi:osmotically-inducible protein OsmY